MLLKPGEKPPFAKIMAISSGFVGILSCDVVTSANFISVDFKKNATEFLFGP